MMQHQKSEHNKWWVLVVIASLLMAAWFAYLSILRHHNFETREFDLGVLGNVISNTSKGLWFQSGLYSGKSFLGIHVSLIYLPIALVYAIFPDVSTLLILQSFAVFGAAILLYAIARQCALPGVAAAVVAGLYLIHPGNQGATLYDFHELAFFPICFFAAVYSLQRQKKAWFYFFLICCLAIKEDISIVLLFSIPLLAILGLAKRDKYLLPAAFIAWYGCTILIREYFSGEPHTFSWYYSDLMRSQIGGVLGIITGIIQDPLYLIETRLTYSRLLYLSLIFLPVGLSVLASWQGLFAVIPGILLTTLSSDKKWELFSISFQYVWYLIPLVYLQFIIYLSKTSREFRKIYLAICAVISLCIFGMYGAHPGAPYHKAGYRSIEFTVNNHAVDRWTVLSTLKQKLNPDEWIACSPEICPHLIDFPRMIACRTWYQDRPPYITVFLGSKAKNCRPETLKKLGFFKEEELEGISLWRRSPQ